MIRIGKWVQASVPHKGWSCIEMHDHGEPTAICEMCEKQVIRYVHVMQHPDYPEQLGCGCICAAEMEVEREGDDPNTDQAKLREQPLRARASRRQGRAKASRKDLEALPHLDLAALQQMECKADERLSRSRDDGDGPIHDQLLQAIRERIKSTEQAATEQAKRKRRMELDAASRNNLAALPDDSDELRWLMIDAEKRISEDPGSRIHNQLLQAVRERRALVVRDIEALPLPPWTPENGIFTIRHGDWTFYAMPRCGGFKVTPVFEGKGVRWSETFPNLAVAHAHIETWLKAELAKT